MEAQLTNLFVMQQKQKVINLVLKRSFGLLYNTMHTKAINDKMHEEKNETIEKWFERNGLVYNRVNELINFYKLTTEYPVILLSDIGYSTFTKYHTKIKKMIEEDDELKNGLCASVNIIYNAHVQHDVEICAT